MGARFYAFAHRESKRERKEARGGLLFISQTGFCFRASPRTAPPHAAARVRMGSASSRSTTHTHRAPSPYPSFACDTMLVQVMSVVDSVTSTVPLPVMLLTNAIRAGHLPDGVAVIQVMPCTETVPLVGQRIFSLWQGTTLEEIAAAVEGIVGDHCTSTLFPVSILSAVHLVVLLSKV